MSAEEYPPVDKESPSTSFYAEYGRKMREANPPAVDIYAKYDEPTEDDELVQRIVFSIYTEENPCDDCWQTPSRHCCVPWDDDEVEFDTFDEDQVLAEQIRRVERAEAILRHPSSQEVRVTDPVTGGQKGQKPEALGFLDPFALMALARVAGYGSMKYETFNYVRGYSWSLSYNALQRHLHAWWGGEDNDPESGLPHLAHAAVHCLFLLTFQREDRGNDDRFGTYLSDLRNSEGKKTVS